MTMAMMRGLDAAGIAGLERRLHIRLQLGEGTLRATQVAGAEGFAKGGEVVLNRAVGRLSTGGLATGLSGLLKLQQCRVSVLGSGEVSGLERTGELLEILLPLIYSTAPIGLGQTQVGRHAGNGHVPINSSYKSLIGPWGGRFDRFSLT